MASNQLSVSWDDYKNNICSGLSLLQQRGEFVDMTLAADGHHVKVHRMVMSLVSPYIKELLTSAQCPHPVIFLNNISHSTLNSILEYIYTGEVLVTKDQLVDVIAAAKSLHIKGLKDMDVTESYQEEDTKDPIADTNKLPLKKTLVDKLQEYKENKQQNVKLKNESPQPMCKVFVDVENSESLEYINDDETMSVKLENKRVEDNEVKKNENIINIESLDVYKNIKQIVQFSISNQGGLQIICNRYIYTLKYVQKKRIRFWRCADSSYKKCPANIYTNDKNEIIRRTFCHTHPFHDQKIIKKLRLGIVYAAFNEAESKATIFKKNAKKVKPLPAPPSSSQDTNSESE